MRSILTIFGCTLLCACETFTPHLCDRSEATNPWLEYTGGVTTCDHDGGSCRYDSTAPNGELLLYRGGMRYHLHHGLGHKPASVVARLSFLEDGGDGELGFAAGDQALEGDDATIISIKNESCVDYFLRVTAN